MKVTSFVLKVAAMILVVASAICLSLAYLDKITDCMLAAKDKVAMRRAAHSDFADMDDYEEWGI